MSDIVERLRRRHEQAAENYGELDLTLWSEAADEIERARADVTMAVEALERIGKQSPEHRALVEQVWKDVSQ